MPNVQIGKIRALGDLKYGDVNPACAARTPIELPIRGHIAAIFLDVEDSNRECPYGVAGHYAAYKHLLMNQSQAGACVATLLALWAGAGVVSPPLALLVGDIAAVLHYNGFLLISEIFAQYSIGPPGGPLFRRLRTTDPLFSARGGRLRLNDFAR